MKITRTILFTSTLAMLALFGLNGSALADTIDPSNLHIGPGLGTPCQMGCAGSPNLISSNSLDIWNVGGGGPYADPILLIIAVPDDSKGTGVPMGITVSTNLSSSASGQLGGSDVYGGKWNTSTGFAGFWTQKSNDDVYTFLHLDLNSKGKSQADNSNNWTNWSGAPGDAHVSGFGIFVYELDNTGLFGKNGINIDFSSDLPTGTLVIAFACTNSSCSQNPNPYDTAFTEAGDMTMSTPEPSIIVFFALDVLLFVSLFRRRELAV